MCECECLSTISVVPSVIVGLSPGKCALPQKWQLPCNAECFPLSTHTPPSVASIHSSSSQPSWMMERQERRIGQTELKRVREEKDKEKEKQVRQKGNWVEKGRHLGIMYQGLMERNRADRMVENSKYKRDKELTGWYLETLSSCCERGENSIA